MARASMRAWVVDDFAASAPLTLREHPAPRLDAGYALVKVSAFSVNYADSLAIRGKYQVRHPLPFVAGSELCGVVLESGGAGGPAVGQRVIAQVDGGAAADLCLVPLNRLRLAPEGLDDIGAAAISVTYPTAHIALCEGRVLRPGDVVLAHAGAGGVGSAAIQLAVRSGARVIATVGSEEKARIARDVGAHEVVNYRDPDWDARVLAWTGGRGVDVIVDVVGGEIADRSLKLLAWRGRYAIVGFASGAIPRLAANRLLTRAAQAAGVWWSADRDGPLLDTIHADLLTGFADGSLRPLIGAVHEFETYDTAIEQVASGKSVGKVVVKV